MKRISQLIPTMLLVAGIAAAPGTVLAQGQVQPAPQGAAKSADDHGAHHPTDTSAAPAAPSASGAAPGQAPGMGMGMMGRGGSGMMGGDMGAMMQHMMPMMRGMMAQRMDRMDGPMGMMSPRRIEGRIAFLRAELKITEAQQPAWNTFADALRGQARSMEDMRQRMMGQGVGQGRGQGMAAPPPAAGSQTRPMGPGAMQGRGAPGGMGGPMTGGPASVAGADMPFPEEADRLVQSLTMRLEAARAIAAAGRALYAVLDDEQKETADELLAMPMRGM